MLILLVVAFITTAAHAHPAGKGNEAQIEQLPPINLEDLAQPLDPSQQVDDVGPSFQFEDPFTDPKDINWEDYVQQPLGGMPPGVDWCPGGIKKLCPKSKVDDQGKG
ncbi:unnamed protein product [Meganyctiphanes norvegica]|uniref:Uncharacterized protein n=1 Tax=Meganyctiphanes norvegica TaxID=48144 RepID=A0AAV2QH02_MEGNR